MSQFLRLLSESDKAGALWDVSQRLRAGAADTRVFDIPPDAFDAVPGKPFAYWVSDAVRQVFDKLPALEANGRSAQHGGSTKDDFRFLRLQWETKEQSIEWTLFAKGGAFSPYYSDIYLAVNWLDDARELEAALLHKYPYLGNTANWVLHRECHYLHPGLTWPCRTTSGLNMRVLPAGCIFSHKGPAAFVAEDAPEELLALLALTNSSAFGLLVSLQLAAADAAARSYEVGVIQKTPIPTVPAATRQQLATFARRAWSLKRRLDTSTETSHAFHLPAALAHLPTADIETELACIQAEIDAIAFDLYGFSQADRQAALVPGANATTDTDHPASDEEDEAEAIAAPAQDGLLSWALGVAFGRFDWRLATGERAAPLEPQPFDPLPAKSPGMLPDGVEPFHAHAGILVENQGHPHDLARLIEEVLVRVEVPVQEDVRRWLQRDFFAFHLQRYSKSRRKAPIYWPLSTTSGNYTLWVYYPSLNNQTLFTAVNDFLDGPNGKLTQVSRECAELRMKGGGRSRDDEKQYETLQTFERELTDLRDTLLKIAPTYQPNHDDGVQITAAPLWPLFRHKPWQKVLKDTWTKLEKGDYDWAHLAMAYWPERVRVKCKTDKSLAIAHGLEDLYVKPEAAPKKTRGKKKAGADE